MPRSMPMMVPCRCCSSVSCGSSCAADAKIVTELPLCRARHRVVKASSHQTWRRVELFFLLQIIVCIVDVSSEYFYPRYKWMLCSACGEACIMVASCGWRLDGRRGEKHEKMARIERKNHLAGRGEAPYLRTIFFRKRYFSDLQNSTKKNAAKDDVDVSFVYHTN